MRNIATMHTTPTLADLHEPQAVSRRARAMVENRLDFLRELVERRIALGLTQAEIADLLGITPQAVSKYERYDWDPRLSTLERYANAVGVVLETTVSECPWSSSSGGEKAAFRVSIHSDEGHTSISLPALRIPSQPQTGAGWASAAESKRTDFALSA